MKISIITASYNYEDYIKEAIDSVLQQSYSDWELIIVDDGSEDKSLEVINAYSQKDKRIKVFTHENNINKGLAETIKLGLSNATGEYVAFLESDDIWVHNYLEEKIKIIQKYSEIGLIFNSVKMFGDNDTISEYDKYFELSKKILNKLKFPRNIFNFMLLSNFIPTFSCVMVKKDILDSCKFETLYSPWLDWALWLQIAYKSPFYYIPKDLTKWRMHKKSYINTSSKKKNNNAVLLKFIQNIFEDEPNILKRQFSIALYSLIIILFKINRSLIKKFLAFLYK